MLVILHRLCDVGDVTLHLLVVLGAVCSVGVVGVLDTVGFDIHLVFEHDLPVLQGVLIVKHAAQQRASWVVLLATGEDVEDERAYLRKLALQCFAVAAIDDL